MEEAFREGIINLNTRQFHINQDNYEHHKKKYFIKALTYQQIKCLLLKHKKRVKIHMLSL